MPRDTVTNTVSLYHLVRTGNKEAYSGSPYASLTDATITPTSTFLQTSIDIPAFEVFDMFLYDMTLGVLQGDKVVDNNGTVYQLYDVPNFLNNNFIQVIKCSAKVVV